MSELAFSELSRGLRRPRGGAPAVADRADRRMAVPDRARTVRASRVCLRSSCGLVDHGGSVTIDGDDTAAMSTRRRARAIAFVPQVPVLPADMTVGEYVLLGRSPFISYFGVASAHDRMTATRFWCSSTSPTSRNAGWTR